jgi:hypothetical protein
LRSGVGHAASAGGVRVMIDQPDPLVPEHRPARGFGLDPTNAGTLPLAGVEVGEQCIWRCDPPQVRVRPGYLAPARSLSRWSRRTRAARGHVCGFGLTAAGLLSWVRRSPGIEPVLAARPPRSRRGGPCPRRWRRYACYFATWRTDTHAASTAAQIRSQFSRHVLGRPATVTCSRDFPTQTRRGYQEKIPGRLRRTCPGRRREGVRCSRGSPIGRGGSSD